MFGPTSSPDAGHADARRVPRRIRRSPRDLPTLRGHIWVPIDDEWTMVYNWVCSADADTPISDTLWQHEKAAGRGPDDFIPGSYRLKRNLSNDFLVDREMQRSRTYTGITGLNTQDFAVQEGMGPICDRSQEHLGTRDRAIIAARRMLREALDDVAEGRQPRRGQSPRSARSVLPRRSWTAHFRGRRP